MNLMRNSPRWLLCGVCLCLLGVTGCASTGKWMASLKKTPSDEPSPKLRLAWAQLKENEGRLSEARTAYQEVLKKKPNEVTALLGLARLDVKAKRMIEAEQGFQKALELAPKSPEVLDQVGQFYVGQEQFDKAVPLLQSAMQAMPHERNYRFHLAVALAKAGRIDESLPHFEETIGAAAGHYNAGRILFEQGKIPAAEQQMVQAVMKDPNLTAAHEWLAEIRSEQQVPSAPVRLAAGTASGTAQQSRVVNAGGNATRPAIQPHGGYEELPPPPQ